MKVPTVIKNRWCIEAPLQLLQSCGVKSAQTERLDSVFPDRLFSRALSHSRSNLDGYCRAYLYVFSFLNVLNAKQRFQIGLYVDTYLYNK